MDVEAKPGELKQAEGPMARARAAARLDPVVALWSE